MGVRARPMTPLRIPQHFEITIETKGEEFTTFETHAYETICIGE